MRLRHGIPFGVRIGLNSGEVVVGRIGDDLRMDYTAQGHTVGLAQRMEALAESGHICLAEHTARLVEGYFRVQDLGRIQVKLIFDSSPDRPLRSRGVGGRTAAVGTTREAPRLALVAVRARAR